MDSFTTFLASAPAPEITSPASIKITQSTSDVADIELVDSERNGSGGGCYCVVS
ncbi:pheromone-like peptide [Pleurotus ostreatus PC15]|uniref:Pheromone-like peptide n=1 Tax=Pleurotus ostreatus (strain PC15) TaxID=1137138 RepID=A0A067NPE3_PLEO1|nr:pheromone-like peptide [Pleurotus ostreatus PC15]